MELIELYDDLLKGNMTVINVRNRSNREFSDVVEKLIISMRKYEIAQWNKDRIYRLLSIHIHESITDLESSFDPKLRIQNLGDINLRESLKKDIIGTVYIKNKSALSLYNYIMINELNSRIVNFIENGREYEDVWGVVFEAIIFPDKIVFEKISRTCGVEKDYEIKI